MIDIKNFNLYSYYNTFVLKYETISMQPKWCPVFSEWQNSKTNFSWEFFVTLDQFFGLRFNLHAREG